MAWTTITKPAVGDSIKKSLIDDVVDDLDFLYDNMGTGALVENGSFENGTSPTDPTGWTSTKWGTGDIETTDPGHGAQGYKFTSIGAGGGYLTMEDFAECSEFSMLVVGWMMKSSVADIRNIVRILWYKKDQTACTTASTDIYDASTGNPTSWQSYAYIVTPPADGRFFKLRLIGADSSDATTGSCIFDGVWVNAYSGENINRDWTIAEETSTDASYTDKSSTTIRFPTNMTSSSVIKLEMYGSVKQNTGGNPAGQRFRVGTDYSNANYHTGTDYVEALFTLYVRGFTGGTMTIYHQLTRDGSVGATTGKKDKPWMSVEVLRW